jgi:metal-responsive CopG/Arc/MetJ family transcriptional regulator
MKRATMTFPDDLAEALDEYVNAQEAPPSLTAVIQVAVREYLEERGFLKKQKPFAIRVASKGSGRHDISQKHDRYLAGLLK